jgi:hypothetical protein
LFSRKDKTVTLSMMKDKGKDVIDSRSFYKSKISVYSCKWKPNIKFHPPGFNKLPPGFDTWTVCDEFNFFFYYCFMLIQVLK